MNDVRPIDANAILEAIEELKKSPWYNGENGKFERLVRNEAIGVVTDLCIKAAPTLDYAPVRHGAWMFITNYPRKGLGFFACSECGTSVELKNFNFCPNCGAKMDGKENE